MSAESSSNTKGASLIWLLGAFAGFAVLLTAIKSTSSRDVTTDPRMDERLANKDEILTAQHDLIAKMGLDDPAKARAAFEKTASILKTQKPVKSSIVVPGSPTQLQQAAAAAPAPAPAAPAAPAPATPAAPAPAPAAQPK
ncbi:MAG: hypothetical protein KDK97_00795 [Verrucomicrobiales bacterium]|nr:hypothetical protein [Verrucomicrobiales bacterium]MCP5557881.1 hypothetical protein [Verrucomicrobiaceae bacterium]